MKKSLIALFVVMALCSMGVAGRAEEKSGEAEFKEHCAVCHPDGGNIINDKKKLHKKDLLANGVKTAADIVKITRNPGPGMTKFDEKTLSDKEAREIAEYIMNKFK